MSEVIHFDQTIDGYADRIAACWRESVESIVQAGRLIAEAKQRLDAEEYKALIRDRLPFGKRTAERLIVVASDPRIAAATHVSQLPPSWGTLYELTRLDDEQFATRIADGTIRPDMERKDIQTAVKQTVRATRELFFGKKILALPQKKYGVILADPEWRFEPWSRQTGMDRSADNHYPTSCTEVIAARNVPAISYSSAVLFLWATVPMLPHALLVMEAWGFDYRSHQAWVKDKPGTGYWFRNEHELLLVGVRGTEVPAPAPGQNWPSTIYAPVGRHSEKPEVVYEMIERLYPTTPKMELNARRERAGWDNWGLDAPSAQAPLIEILPPVRTITPPTIAREIEEDHPGIPDFLKREAIAAA